MLHTRVNKPDVCNGRRPTANIDKAEPANDLFSCVINKHNLNDFVKKFLLEIFEFERCVKSGTNLKMAISALNSFNNKAIELNKFLARNIPKNKLNNYSMKLGKITIDFKHVLENEYQLDDLHEFLYELKREILSVYKKLRGEVLNKNFSREKQNKINELIAHTYRLKEHLTLPARSERIISIIVDSNEEQLCYKKEIQNGVYVRNCIIKPKKWNRYFEYTKYYKFRGQIKKHLFDNSTFIGLPSFEYKFKFQ